MKQLYPIALGVLMFLLIDLSQKLFEKRGHPLTHGIVSVLIVVSFVVFILTGGGLL